jgi:hypothetical protein
MNMIHIAAAQPTLSSDPPAGVTIVIAGEIVLPKPPRHQEHDTQAYFSAIAAVFDADAQALFIALRDNLPGGTLDRLMAKLLTYKATHFVVAHKP